MARDVKVQWYRGGSDSSHRQSPDLIPMQVDNMNMREAAYYQGMQPHFLYNGYVNSRHYAFAYRDLLIDPNTLDPLTEQPTQYRVVNDPKVRTLSGYVMLALNRMVGK